MIDTKKMLYVDDDGNLTDVNPAVEKYTGVHYVGELLHFGEHEVRVTEVWNVDERNGVSIIPTGGYGFEIDVFEDRL